MGGNMVEKIKKAIELLNEIDSIIENNPKELKNVEDELLDLYHLIENNELNDEASINVIKKINELRKIRREYKNVITIATTYNTHKSKLSGRETRGFLLGEINKTIKLLGVKYANRILTSEDIENILEPKKKRGRPPKIKEETNEGEDKLLQVTDNGGNN